MIEKEWNAKNQISVNLSSFFSSKGFRGYSPASSLIYRSWIYKIYASSIYSQSICFLLIGFFSLRLSADTLLLSVSIGMALDSTLGVMLLSLIIFLDGLDFFCSIIQSTSIGSCLISYLVDWRSGTDSIS